MNPAAAPFYLNCHPSYQCQAAPIRSPDFQTPPEKVDQILVPIPRQPVQHFLAAAPMYISQVAEHTMHMQKLLCSNGPENRNFSDKTLRIVHPAQASDGEKPVMLTTDFSSLAWPFPVSDEEDASVVYQMQFFQGENPKNGLDHNVILVLYEGFLDALCEEHRMFLFLEVAAVFFKMKERDLGSNFFNKAMHEMPRTWDIWKLCGFHENIKKVLSLLPLKHRIMFFKTAAVLFKKKNLYWRKLESLRSLIQNLIEIPLIQKELLKAFPLRKSRTQQNFQVVWV